MITSISPSTRAAGFWSAVLSAGFSITYVVAQLAEWMGWMGSGGGLERVARLFLLANGLLLPFIALQMFAHWLIWIAALWAVTFPGAAWSLALLFRRTAAAGGGVAPG